LISFRGKPPEQSENPRFRYLVQLLRRVISPRQDTTEKCKHAHPWLEQDWLRSWGSETIPFASCVKRLLLK